MVHRVGIIGLGTVGSRFVEQFNSHDAFELVAAWDVDPNACSSHKKLVNIAEDANAVIQQSELVYIAVPPLHHSQYVKDCLNNETAIFCEKPLGIDVHSSQKLVAEVEQSNLPAGVNFVFSAAPSAARLQQMVTDAELGDLVRADLRFHFSQWPRSWHDNAQWLRFRDQGGWVREVVSHFIFLANRILGDLKLEHNYVHYEDGSEGSLCETTALAHLSSPSVPVSLAGTSLGAGSDVVDLTLRGSNGAVRIWDWYRLQVFDQNEGWIDSLNLTREQLGIDAYTAQLSQLDRMMRGEDHTIATFREALVVQECVESLLAG